MSERSRRPTKKGASPPKDFSEDAPTNIFDSGEREARDASDPSDPFAQATVVDAPPATAPDRPAAKPSAASRGTTPDRPGAKPIAGSRVTTPDRPGAKPIGAPATAPDRPSLKPIAAPRATAPDRPGAKAASAGGNARPQAATAQPAPAPPVIQPAPAPPVIQPAPPVIQAAPAKPVIHTISMKTPADPNLKPVPKPEREMPHVQLRAMSEISRAQIPLNLGNLAPPYDPAEARKRTVRDYAVWGSLVVILASAIALTVWFAAT